MIPTAGGALDRLHAKMSSLGTVAAVGGSFTVPKVVGEAHLLTASGLVRAGGTPFQRRRSLGIFANGLLLRVLASAGPESLLDRLGVLFTLRRRRP